MLILAYDGDNAGRLVGRAILGNDLNELSAVSHRIELGHEIVRSWVESHGGSVISGGGDEGTFQVPEEALEDIERLRQDYLYSTNLTMTIGVGQTLSEAGKSLMVGKFRGKNAVVRYDDAVEAELIQAQENVEKGIGSSEEKKLSDAYLKPEDGNPVPKEDEIAGFIKQDLNPPGITKPDPSKEPPIGQGSSMETESNNNAVLDNTMKESVREQNSENILVTDPVEQAAEANNQKAADVHSKEGINAILEAIEQEEGGGETEEDLMDHIDAEDLAIGKETEGNVSRPEGFSEQNTPNDMGLGEDAPEAASPDVSGVLQEGLDSHAENMQREKVVDMIGQALAGFKAQKHILERAKEKAPELYNSCLAMLKSMIEMSKMLGLGQSQQNPLDEQASVEEMAQDPAQEQMQDQNEVAAPTAEDDCPYCEPPATEDSLHDCPYCKQSDVAPPAASEESLHDCPYCKEGESHEQHKDKLKPEAKPAAPKGGAAPSPKEKG